MTGQRDLDYGLGETIDVLRESVREFVRDEVAPVVAAAEHEADFSPVLWQEMGGLGLLGITLPAEYGGAGMGLLEHVVVMEEISRGSASLGLAYCGHSHLCVHQLRLNGNEEQKGRYLPGLISGEIVGALAAGGAEGDVDSWSLDLSAFKQGAFYCLNGVTNSMMGAPAADLFIIFARTSLEGMPLEISALILEKNTPGMHQQYRSDTVAKTPLPSLKLSFDHCLVSKQSLLGEGGQVARVLFGGLQCEKLILAGGALGVMAACLDQLLPAVQLQRFPGFATREIQLMQGKVAEIYSAWCACRAYVYTVASAADWGIPMHRDANAALLFTAKRASDMVLETLAILGACDQAGDVLVGRLLRDAQLFEKGFAIREERRQQVSRGLFPIQA